jgi:hypothetical protein
MTLGQTKFFTVMILGKPLIDGPNEMKSRAITEE